MPSLSGLSQGLQYQPPISSTGSYLSTTQASIVEADSEVAEASVSLSTNLNHVAAATGTGQLTLEFARALQSATDVDPVTGHLQSLPDLSAKAKAAAQSGQAGATSAADDTADVPGL